MTPSYRRFAQILAVIVVMTLGIAISGSLHFDTLGSIVTGMFAAAVAIGVWSMLS